MNFNFTKDMQNYLISNIKKPFVLVINSNNRTSGNNNNAFYNFDWFVWPDVPYHVSFVFVGSNNNAYVAGTAPTAKIYNDFGENSTTYYCVANSNEALTTTYIGANYYLYSEKLTNPPIYLNGRSNNRLFQVRILTDAGANFDISMLDLMMK